METLMTDEEKKERRKQYLREWQQNNRDKVSINYKRYRDKNKEELNRKSRERRINNPERYREIQARYYKNKVKTEEDVAKLKLYLQANREKINAQRRAAYQMDPTKKRAAYTEWRKNNPEKHCARVQKHNAEKMQATPSWLTKEDWKLIEAFYCRAAELTKSTGIEHHVDHIYPIKGRFVSGLHVPCNLHIINKSENSQKHNKHPEDFYGDRFPAILEAAEILLESIRNEKICR